MLIFLGLIFWLTIIGANYPSQMLFSMFAKLQEIFVNALNFVNCPTWIIDVLYQEYIQTLTWVIQLCYHQWQSFFHYSHF